MGWVESRFRMSFFTAACPGCRPTTNPRFNCSVDYVHACVNHGIDVIGRARTSRRQKKRLKHCLHVELSCARYSSHLDLGSMGASLLLAAQANRNSRASQPSRPSQPSCLSLFVLSCNHSVPPTRSLFLSSLYTGESLTFSHQHRRYSPLSLSSKRSVRRYCYTTQTALAWRYLINTLRFTIPGSVTPL
jgi:hypothetical protein